MAGLVPAIYVFMSDAWRGVDGRNKPGHDESNLLLSGSLAHLNHSTESVPA
jgi:hypothetical protein